MKKYILLPNLTNVKNKVSWIKEVREITGMGLKQAKVDFCEKVYQFNEGTNSEPKWYTQEYPLSEKEFIEMGLDQQYILEEMIKKGFIRCEGSSDIRAVIDQALNSRKYKHAIELIKVLEKLGEM